MRIKNYYDILGVASNASQEDIKRAYRKLARRYHPDVNSGSKEAEKIFKEINEAYHILSNEAARKNYDDRQSAPEANSKGRPEKSEADHRSRTKYQGFGAKDVEQSFEDFFGFNPRTKEMKMKKENKSNSPKNPIDTTELFEKYFGARKK